jgi:hypothetical protein
VSPWPNRTSVRGVPPFLRVFPNRDPYDRCRAELAHASVRPAFCESESQPSMHRGLFVCAIFDVFRFNTVVLGVEFYWVTLKLSM